MKTFARAIFSCVGCLLSLSSARGQTPQPGWTSLLGSHAPPVYTEAGAYELQWRQVAGAGHKGSIWEIRSAPNTSSRDDRVAPPPAEVFASLTSPKLREWVSRLPPGSSLLCGYVLTDPGLEPPHDYVPLPKAFNAEQRDFTAYCHSKGILIFEEIIGP